MIIVCTMPKNYQANHNLWHKTGQLCVRLGFLCSSTPKLLRRTLSHRFKCKNYWENVRFGTRAFDLIAKNINSHLCIDRATDMATKCWTSTLHWIYLNRVSAITSVVWRVAWNDLVAVCKLSFSIYFHQQIWQWSISKWHRLVPAFFSVLLAVLMRFDKTTSKHDQSPIRHGANKNKRYL